MRRGPADFTIPTQYQINCPSRAYPPIAKNAVIAVEDTLLAQASTARIVGAVIQDIRKARAAKLGTITQQLARMSFLSADKTLRQDKRGVSRAAEQIYPGQILEFYPNVPFRDGLFGAGRRPSYFDKTTAELSPAEGALLAALVKRRRR